MNVDAIHRTPPPGTEIISTGTVQKGDWFFITTFGAWALVPAIGYGEKIAGCGHLVARALDQKHNTVKRDEAAWKN